LDEAVGGRVNFLQWRPAAAVCDAIGAKQAPRRRFFRGLWSPTFRFAEVSMRVTHISAIALTALIAAGCKHETKTPIDTA
jgi:hypothetical protein